MAYLGGAQDLIKAREIRDKSIDVAKLLARNDDQANSVKNIISGIYDEYFSAYLSAYQRAQKDIWDYISSSQKEEFWKYFNRGLGENTPGLRVNSSSSLIEFKNSGFKIDGIENYANPELYVKHRDMNDIVKDYLLGTMEWAYFGETLEYRIFKILKILSPEKYVDALKASGLVPYESSDITKFSED